MDSPSTLNELSPSQDNQELRINESFEATSMGSLFARDEDVSGGLTWGYLGGKIMVNGVVTTIAKGSFALTASSTRYIQVTQAGVVSAGASRVAGSMPLYVVTVGASAPTSWIDERTPGNFKRCFEGIGTQAMADANQTLTQEQSLCETLVTTGALTATRNLVVPLVRRTWTVQNNCTGGSIQVIGASGTGITIATGKVAIVRCDGTNVLRITADT